MNSHRQAGRSSWQQRGLTALLLVFLLRVVLPPGYMPVFLYAGHGSALSVTLCAKGLPDSAVRHLAIDTHHDSVEPQDLSCAFASATGQAFFLPPLAQAFFTGGADSTPHLVYKPSSLGNAHIAGPPFGPRGPPFFV